MSQKLISTMLSGKVVYSDSARMKVIAITDSYSSPLTIDAAHVIEFPIEGPQYMPTLSAAFMAVELILAALASHSSNASRNIQQFEEQILKYGGYIS